MEVEVIYGDDQTKPDVGVQVAEEMLKKHNVDIVAGIIWSNVMMAVQPVVNGAGKIMVGANAGASPLAGSAVQRALLLDLVEQRPDARGDGQVPAGHRA